MKEKNIKNNSIKEKVFDQIEHRRLSMRSRRFFVLKAGAIIVGSLFLSLLIFYTISLIVFGSYHSGTIFLPSFGWSGFWAMIRTLPWGMILFVLASLVCLQLLIRRYALVYLRARLVSLAIMVGLVVIGGFLVLHFDFHRFVWQQTEGSPLQLLYQEYVLSPRDDIHSGMIEEITDDRILLVDESGIGQKIFLSEKTSFPRGTELKIGQAVLAWGEFDNGRIVARGIRRLPGFPSEDRGPNWRRPLRRSGINHHRNRINDYEG